MAVHRIRVAERHLAKADAVMAGLIAAHGPCTLDDARPAAPFRVLARSIVSQQLSTKAAETIAARVRSAIGGPIGPRRLLAVPPEALRGAGLSGAKVRYLLELSRRVVAGELDFAALAAVDDDAALASLTDIPGVGRWTAEMFLIFALGRLNVLALGDAGLRRAARSLYGVESLAELEPRWQPYCSVASWYLWRAIDG